MRIPPRPGPGGAWIRWLLGAWLLLGFGGALAKTYAAIDLKSALSEQTVEASSYCAGIFRVGLKDGTRREFGEIDLRLKTDPGPLGPRPEMPARCRAESEVTGQTSCPRALRC